MSTLKQLVDETTNIKNELITCHANLKTNLIDKGVQILEEDKILNLVRKIADIKELKFAIGTTSVTGSGSYSINGLDFKPNLVIMTYKEDRISLIFSELEFVGEDCNNLNILCNDSTAGFEKYALSGVYAGVYDDGFKIYMSTGYTSTRTCNWFACKLNI